MASPALWGWSTAPLSVRLWGWEDASTLKGRIGSRIVHQNQLSWACVDGNSPHSVTEEAGPAKSVRARCLPSALAGFQGFASICLAEPVGRVSCGYFVPGFHESSAPAKVVVSFEATALLAGRAEAASFGANTHIPRISM